MFASLQPTKKYFVVMFLISCFLLEIFTFVIYKQSRTNNVAVDRIIGTSEVIRQGRLTMMDAVDLSNKELEYIQTPNDGYFEAYDTYIKNIDKNISQFRNTAKENPEQLRSITMVCDQLDHLEEVLASHLDAFHKGETSPDKLKTYQSETSQAVLNARTAYRGFGESANQTLQDNISLAKVGRASHLWTLAMGDILSLGALLIANLVIFSLIGRNSRFEDSLRKSEELFAKVLDGINDGVYDYNIKEGTIYYSPSYQKMMGYSAKELGTYHEDFAKFIHPDDMDETRYVLRQYLDRKISSFYNIFRVRHKDGRWIWVMSRGIGIWDNQGNAERLIGTHTDISIQKQHEEELNYFIRENERQQAELGLAIEKADAANQAKSDFLATMSHEIRTPMNAVIGLAELLLRVNLAPKHHAMVETLHSNADILLKLVNDLLDVSRIEAGQIELESHNLTFPDLFKSLHSVFDSQAAAKNINLVMTNNLEEQAYLGDAARIHQILVNLINNALKFTLRGTVSVTADGVEQPDGMTALRITVADTGVGIPPEKLSTVFEKFVQADQSISRRYGGSGLGLAICKSLADLMGGTISVESKVDQGSLFTLTLYLKTVKQPLRSVPQEAVPVPTDVLFGKVLVVEDYAANVMVATMMLESLGFAVEVASNGAEALLKVRECKIPYTAILMDVQMQGIDGYETTRRIRALEREKNIRHFIIGVTAHALSGDREKCLAASMDDYMSKPINFNILAQKLKLLSEAA